MSFANSNNFRFVNHSLVVGSSSNTVTALAPGTSGNVLTSNGTDFVSSTPASQFTPNSILTLYDDFFDSHQVVSFLSGQLTWNVNGSNQWTQNLGQATNAHPGVVSHTNITSASRSLFLGDGSVNGGLILGGGAITLNWVFNIANLSNGTNRYTLNLGMGDVVSSSTINNGTWFQYSDNINSGNWTFNTAAAASPTNSNSSTAVTTGWHNAQITINAAGTLVTYVMDGVTLGTIALTIPTLGILPMLSIIWSAGTVAQQSILVDLFYLKQTLTTAR